MRGAANCTVLVLSRFLRAFNRSWGEERVTGGQSWIDFRPVGEFSGPTQEIPAVFTNVCGGMRSATGTVVRRSRGFG